MEVKFSFNSNSIKQMHKFKDEEEYNQFLFKGFAYGINIRKMGSIEAIKQNFKHILSNLLC